MKREPRIGIVAEVVTFLSAAVLGVAPAAARTLPL
jgi:hypothetical protein